MNTSATVKMLLDPQSKEQARTIKLRVTFNRVTRFYATLSKEKLTEEEFLNNRKKVAKNALEQAQYSYNIANDIIKDLGVNFTFEAFKLKYYSQMYGKDARPRTRSLNDVFEAYCKQTGISYNTQVSYKTAIRYVLKYKPDAMIEDFTTEFVDEVISFIKSNFVEVYHREISVNSLGMYLRALRSICNFATEMGYIDKVSFRKRIHSEARLNPSLTYEEWEKFISFTPQAGSALEFVYEMVILDFALSGANFADIFELKNENLHNRKYIEYVRTKTKRASAKVFAPLCKTSLKILEKYGRIDEKKPEAYILPYYTMNMTEKQKAQKRSGLIKKINNGIKEITSLIGIRSFTTYNIRHTFSTYARDVGHIETSQLKLLLGHKDETTTEIYLNSISSIVLSNTQSYLDKML